jgi:hypothetical protein
MLQPLFTTVGTSCPTESTSLVTALVTVHSKNPQTSLQPALGSSTVEYTALLAAAASTSASLGLDLSSSSMTRIRHSPAQKSGWHSVSFTV